MIDNSEKWKDISGDPLIDVNIQVKGTTRGATTDFDGEFEIEADLQDTLLFSYVGYKTLSVAIDGRTRVDGEMEQDVSQLDEVIVVADGRATRGTYTGAAAVIDDKEIKDIRPKE